MSRIKLPGKERNKKILLVILIIAATLVIIFEGYSNMTRNKIKNKENQQQEEITEPTNSSDKNTGRNITIHKDKVEISAVENQLYSEAYNCFFLGEKDKAITKADGLLKKFPNSYMGYNIRGIAKAYNGDYDGGMKDIDKALKINQNYGYARFNKALAYELYNHMDDSLKWYNKALEIEDYVWTYYGIASIYGRRGDVKNTVIYLNRAISMNENIKNKAKIEPDFNAVKNSKEFQKIIN